MSTNKKQDLGSSADMSLDLEFEEENCTPTNKETMTFSTHFLETADASIFRDRFSLVYGGSNSGKTTVVQYIIKAIRDNVPNFIIVTPESSRHFYENLVPKTSIWDNISEQDINNIVNRQEDAKKVKDVTEKLEVLHLIHMIVSPEKANQFLLELKKRDLGKDDEIRILRSRLGSGNASVQEKIKAVLMKKMISLEYGKKFEIDLKDFGPLKFNIYRAMNISEKSLKENPSLEILKIIYNAYCYMDMNHRFCLVIDDMTPLLKTITNYTVLERNPFEGEVKGKTRACDKKNIFVEISTRGRHIGLSVIIITHVFKAIESCVRENFNICLFTNKEAFDKAMPEISADDFVCSKKQAIASKVYGKKDENGGSHVKIVYEKLDNSVTDDNKSKKLKMIKANMEEAEFLETTKFIDSLIEKHGDSDKANYSF